MKPLAFLALVALCGCAVGPDFQSPAAPDTQTYTHEAQPATTVAASGVAGASQTFVAVEHATPMWWKQFQSHALNRLVEQAMQQSPSLTQARAKLVEARENYNAQFGATAFPAVDATVSGVRQRVDIAAFGIPNVPSQGPFTLYNASVSVSYALDIFGGNRRALEALMAQADYQSFEFEAARLSLAGNVVSTAIRRASLQQQIALTQRLADTQAQQLKITEGQPCGRRRLATRHLRSQRSHAARPDPRVVAAADHAARAGRSSTRDLAWHAAFEGGLRRPDARSSLRLPDTLPLTLPSTLARERPDIRASEALLHQASANVGVATANLYPQFSISAGIGSERTNIQDVVSGLNIWNFGLNLTQPIFRGGELRAKKRSAQAAYDAALADYQQTVLQALQQVADTLTALQNDAHELQARDDAAQQAQASLDIAQAQYSAGGVSQFGLLDTQRQVLQTALDRTRAQADRFADTAALFQSLGGGWQAKATSTP